MQSRTKLLLVVIGLIIIAAAIALALKLSSTPTPVTPVSSEERLQAYTTSYTYWDNTPPGSSIIAFAKTDGFPTLHDKAGGTGIYEDPITLAVGHVLVEATDTPDFPPGTRFYIPNVRRYFIVEDTCGDGDKPQDIPCHNLNNPQNKAPAGATVWLDLWIDGKDGTAKTVDDCANLLTQVHTVIKDPEPDYLVVAGPVFENSKCSEQYGEEPVKK